MAPKYKGILARPIGKNEIKDYPLALERRLDALCKFHNINPKDKNCLAQLALQLADCHVPGFRVGSSTRTRSSNAGRDADLVLSMGAIMWKMASPSASAAARKLIKRRPEYGYRSHGALRVRFEWLTHKGPDADVFQELLAIQRKSIESRRRKL